MLKPKHTLSSVIESLLAGLADGTIVLESAESRLFPNLAQELEWAFTSSGREPLPPLPAFLPTFLERLFRTQARFSNLASDLELMIQLTRELRRTPNRSLAQDVGWYARLIARKTGNTELTHQAKLLEIAVEEGTPIVEEVAIQLQLHLAEVLKTVIGKASSWEWVKKLVWELLPAAVPDQHNARQVLDSTFHMATQARIDDVQALIQILQMALKRAQATIPIQAADTAAATRSGRTVS